MHGTGQEGTQHTDANSPFASDIPLSFKKNCNPRTCLLILERGAWEGKREREGKETSVWERNINWLPLTHTLAGDQTHNLGTCPDLTRNRTCDLSLYRMTLPTKWAIPARAPLPLLMFYFSKSELSPKEKCEASGRESRVHGDFLSQAWTQVHLIWEFPGRLGSKPRSADSEPKHIPSSQVPWLWLPIVIHC